MLREGTSGELHKYLSEFLVKSIHKMFSNIFCFSNINVTFMTTVSHHHLYINACLVCNLRQFNYLVKASVFLTVKCGMIMFAYVTPEILVKIVKE